MAAYVSGTMAFGRKGIAMAAISRYRALGPALQVRQTTVYRLLGQRTSAHSSLRVGFTAWNSVSLQRKPGATGEGYKP
jgi:hypothetical protein